MVPGRPTILRASASLDLAKAFLGWRVYIDSELFNHSTASADGVSKPVDLDRRPGFTYPSAWGG